MANGVLNSICYFLVFVCSFCCPYQLSFGIETFWEND